MSWRAATASPAISRTRARFAVRSRASAPRDPGPRPRSRGPRGAGRRSAARSSEPRGASAAPGPVARRRRSRSASRTSGRSKNRWPRTRNGIRAFVRAASIGGTWALIRTRTAISDAGVPPSMRRADRRDEVGELGVGVGEAADRGRRPGRLRRHEALASTLRRQEAVGEGEDLGRGPVVPRQRDLARARVPLDEARQVVRRRAGERVDRLVLVADDAQVVAVAEPELEEALLERVRVLVLVDAEPALPGADRRGGVRVGLEEGRPSRRGGRRSRSGRRGPSPARSRRRRGRRGRPGSAARARRRPPPARSRAARSAAPSPIRSRRPGPSTA